MLRTNQQQVGSQYLNQCQFIDKVELTQGLLVVHNISGDIWAKKKRKANLHFIHVHGVTALMLSDGRCGGSCHK